MSYWGKKLEKLINEQNEQETTLTPEMLPALTLTEFARRNIAIEIYSEVLGCNLWLCSNNEMKAQIVRDAPGQVYYTAKELRNLVKLDLSPKDLMKIHEAKEIFSNSRLNGANKAN